MNFARRYPLLGEARANEIAAVYAPYIKNENFTAEAACVAEAAGAAKATGGISDAAFLLGIARRLSGETL